MKYSEPIRILQLLYKNIENHSGLYLSLMHSQMTDAKGIHTDVDWCADVGLLVTAAIKP